MGDDEVCRVLEVIRRDARCPSVSFTGGEPTLRPGLVRFVRHAKGLGLRVNLISNGQRIGERLAGELREAGLDSAQLSLEGGHGRYARRARRPGGGLRAALAGRRPACARAASASTRTRP